LLLNSHHSAVKHFSKVIVKNLPPSFGMNSAFSVAEAMQVSENNRQNTAQNFLCNNVVILVSLAGEQIKSQSVGWKETKGIFTNFLEGSTPTNKKFTLPRPTEKPVGFSSFFSFSVFGSG
jgi:hypothetical protein